MAASTHEARLLDAIAKQNVLLVAAQKQVPDFACLVTRDVLLHQAQCWLSLARLRRLSAVRSSVVASGSLSLSVALDDAALSGVKECLAQARRLYFAPDRETSTTKSFLQGQALVLVEEAELLSLGGQTADALATLDDALQRCRAHGDRATESLVQSKREALQLERDMWTTLDQLALGRHETAGEREILLQCFMHLARANDPPTVLRKDQLAVFARDLGALSALSQDEADAIWTQIHAHDHRLRDHRDAVDFDAVWRWWSAEDMYEGRSHRIRRTK